MKITQSTLRKIIKEELQAAINEIEDFNMITIDGAMEYIDHVEDDPDKFTEEIKAALLRQLQGMKSDDLQNLLSLINKKGDYSENPAYQTIAAAAASQKDNNLKLTESQLRKIIREELEAVTSEANGDFQYGSMRGDRFLDADPHLKAAADIKAAIGAKLGGPSFRASSDLKAIMAHYRMGPARAEFDDSVNAIVRGESNADAEAAQLLHAYEQRLFDPSARRAAYGRR